MKRMAQCARTRRMLCHGMLAYASTSSRKAAEMKVPESHTHATSQVKGLQATKFVSFDVTLTPARSAQKPVVSTPAPLNTATMSATPMVRTLSHHLHTCSACGAHQSHQHERPVSNSTPQIEYRHMGPSNMFLLSVQQASSLQPEL